MFSGPKRVGRYELVSEIASGGMGRVYLARARGPLGFEKLGALKTVHPELASEKAFVEMFFDEARIAARIDHPNVCRVFDFGEADGQYFIAMEYLVGQNAAKLLRKVSAMPEPEPLYEAFAAKIIADAAEGLHAAHELTDERGRPLEVVHRDVSPQNLFITYDGAVRVLDFGVASAHGRMHHTTTGSVKGKFGYMAPEQMRREKADRRSDIWSLGVVLWELLTWQRLYKTANELDVVLAVLNDPVRRPSEVCSVDPALEAIVMRALQKDPGARHATARELAQELNRFILGRNEVIGLAEMSAFMCRLFPAERTSALEAVERAASSDPAREVLPASGPSDPKPVTPDIEINLSTVAPSRTPARGRPVLYAGTGVALLAAVAGGAWWSASQQREEPVATAGITPIAPDPVGPLAVAAPDAPHPDAGVLLGSAVPSDADAGSSVVAEGSPRLPTKRRVAHVDEPAASGTGVLVVETPGGWADVFVDGQRLGRTPLRVEIPTGPARVELRPFGLASGASDTTMRRRVTVGSSPTRVVVNLAP